MSRILETYIRKRAFRRPWKIRQEPNKIFPRIIVIPAYAEQNYLPDVLTSINSQTAKLLKETAVIIVINNGESADKNVLKDNRATMDYLINVRFSFYLGVIDAFSPGMALPDKQAGVGMARKIGLDLSLPFASPDTLLFSTDADCILADNYLQRIFNDHAAHRWHAVVAGFKHRRTGNDRMDTAITEYENFLITTAEKLRGAGSIYGYPAVGSTMVSTAAAYASVGGMSRKKATEDFYFLQELAKFCGVRWIRDILVYPSSRAEKRVFLGTGFRMTQVRNGFRMSSLYYHDDAFQILQAWINLGQASKGKALDTILTECAKIHCRLPGFLQWEKIGSAWEGLQRSSPSETHFNMQFNRWFDGLKTIRLLKYFTEILK